MFSGSAVPVKPTAPDMELRVYLKRKKRIIIDKELIIKWIYLKIPIFFILPGLFSQGR